MERAARQRDRVQLLLGRGDQRRVPVAEVERGVRREHVEVAPALDVGDPGALASADHHGERVVVVRAVLVLEGDRLGRRPDLLGGTSPLRPGHRGTRVAHGATRRACDGSRRAERRAAGAGRRRGGGPSLGTGSTGSRGSPSIDTLLTHESVAIASTRPDDASRPSSGGARRAPGPRRPRLHHRGRPISRARDPCATSRLHRRGRPPCRTTCSSS